MKILTKNKLLFRVNFKEFTTAGRNTVEEAPDWIRQDPYFGMAERAGILTVISDSTSSKKHARPHAPSSPPAEKPKVEPEGGDGVSLEGGAGSTAKETGTRPNKTTANELASLGAKEAIAVVATVDDLDVLLSAKELEEKKKKPRATVIGAIDDRVRVLIDG